MVLRQNEFLAVAEVIAERCRAKDFLNRQAKPASGASIAFTLLVVQGRDQAGGDAGASRVSLPGRPIRAWCASRAGFAIPCGR